MLDTCNLGRIMIGGVFHVSKKKIALLLCCVVLHQMEAIYDGNGARMQ